MVSNSSRLMGFTSMIHDLVQNGVVLFYRLEKRMSVKEKGNRQILEGGTVKMKEYRQFQFLMAKNDQPPIHRLMSYLQFFLFCLFWQFLSQSWPVLPVGSNVNYFSFYLLDKDIVIRFFFFTQKDNYEKIKEKSN